VAELPLQIAVLSALRTAAVGAVQIGAKAIPFIVVPLAAM
jgi:hypothetical protein